VVNLVEMARSLSTRGLSDSSSNAHEILETLELHGEAAKLVADPHKGVYLYPFIGKTRTANEVALEYNLKLSTLLYQIRRFLKLGLLFVERAETRNGSAVKHYRAVANAFFVPLEATNQDSVESLLELWTMALQDIYVRSFCKTLLGHSSRWGVRIARQENGRLTIMPATEAGADWSFVAPESPVLLEGWHTDLHLDFKDAKDFQAELIALYIKYYGREGAQRYIVRVALAPMDASELPKAW
jgi:hypothetical protein